MRFRWRHGPPNTDRRAESRWGLSALRAFTPGRPLGAGRGSQGPGEFGAPGPASNTAALCRGGKARTGARPATTVAMGVRGPTKAPTTRQWCIWRARMVTATITSQFRPRRSPCHRCRHDGHDCERRPREPAGAPSGKTKSHHAQRVSYADHRDQGRAEHAKLKSAPTYILLADLLRGKPRRN